MKTLLTLFSFGLFLSVSAQTYTSHFTGSFDDLETEPLGGVCLMGGAGEADPASTWFLEQANGGDILVLRASGSDGYNDYFYSDLGVSVNSVETIVFHEAAAAEEGYIHEQIQKAEAIWFAGGNQWTYISYWRNTAIDSLIRKGIAERDLVVGGTSAGMAILGDVYFSAENGTVTSYEALNNPFHPNVTADSTRFIDAPFLSETITDTHYDDPDRKGRHLVFMSRMLMDYGINAKGIACDEYTAVCIDPEGMAHVYGAFPDYDDNAYFLQTNCDLPELGPEVFEDETALTWSHDQQAVRVYAVKGTATGENTFDLTNWRNGSGGEWQFWSADDGLLTEEPGTAPLCDLGWSNLDELTEIEILNQLGYVKISASEPMRRIVITSISGAIINDYQFDGHSKFQFQIAKDELPNLIMISVETNKGIKRQLMAQ